MCTDFRANCPTSRYRSTLWLTARTDRLKVSLRSQFDRNRHIISTIVAFGCVSQLAERRSLAGELTLSYARPAADGWPLYG